jgi:multiple inositol-polyphosphate phosphatase/2,3-bisphosphoglycerate 3-phosphatase
MDAFEQGPEYREMLEQVNRKLGFFGADSLNSRDVRTVWDFCKFELGWNPSTPSPWCAAFSIANNAVMDYLEDLDYYYGMGYGGDVPIFANMNCLVMQDLLRFLQSNDPNDQLARLYSTHSRALQLFLVTLGVFGEDEPLTRHNYAQQTFRQWRSGLIAPMASNFAVVRFE